MSYSAATEAMRADYGRRVFPSYQFGQAETVVSLNADFLGTWGDNVWYTAEWAKTRRPEDGAMSRLHAFESGMSLTGSNADRTHTGEAIRARPCGCCFVARDLRAKGQLFVLDEAVMASVKAAAADLKKSGAKGLVVAGDNDLGNTAHCSVPLTAPWMRWGQP